MEFTTVNSMFSRRITFCLALIILCAGCDKNAPVKDTQLGASSQTIFQHFDEAVFQSTDGAGYKWGKKDISFVVVAPFNDSLVNDLDQLFGESALATGITFKKPAANQKMILLDNIDIIFVADTSTPEQIKTKYLPFFSRMEPEFKTKSRLEIGLNDTGENFCEGFFGVNAKNELSKAFVIISVADNKKLNNLEKQCAFYGFMHSLGLRGTKQAYTTISSSDHLNFTLTSLDVSVLGLLYSTKVISGAKRKNTLNTIKGILLSQQPSASENQTDKRNDL